MHIFFNRRIKCDGTLTKWAFVARKQYISGLYLAVFRILALHNGGRRFFIVGVTPVNGVYVGDDSIDNWVFLNEPIGIPVKQGDILGFFYDDHQQSPMASTSLVIRSRFTNVNFTPTISLALDKNSGARPNGRF